MGYTHHDKVSANSFAIGQKGSEVDLNVDQEIINGVIDDISSASTHWMVSPYAGTIESIYSVIDTAITTAAAATISFKVGTTAASDVTGGDITIAAGATAGTVDSSTPTAERTLTAGQAVAMITDGGSTNASKAEISMVIKRT